MAGTAKNYDVTKLQQGPSDLWIIGSGVVDSASPQLTLATDGTPDSVAHANSICLGLSVDAMSFTSKPKMSDISADQFDGPLTRFVDSQAATIEADLEQLDLALMQNVAPYMTYSTAAGYKQLTGGGQVVLATPCVALITPKLGAAGKYYVTILFKAHGMLGATVSFGRKKPASYKVQFDGLIDPTRTAGRQMFVAYETI